MTHGVGRQTSTGLIAAPWTVSTWVKWAERLSAVRWVEVAVLPLIWLLGWIPRGCSQSGRSQVSAAAWFYSRGGSVITDAGGQRGTPKSRAGVAFQTSERGGMWAQERACMCVSRQLLFVFIPASFVQPSQQHRLTTGFQGSALLAWCTHTGWGTWVTHFK